MTAVQPIASVLVLAYNHGRYIRDALQGIVQQEFDGPFEVLVGDDASTDDTGSIALEFAGRYPDLIKVVRRVHNVGMHANHGDLVARAQGEFIAYCEGDDFWTDRRKLQKQVDLLRAHPECGAVHTDFSHLERRMGRWRMLPSYNEATARDIPVDGLAEALLRENLIQTCTFCVRTSLLRDYLSAGLPIATYPVGDWPLFFHVANRSEVAYLPEPTAVYRRVRGSAMNSGHRARLRTALGYLPMIEDFCRQRGAGEGGCAEATLPLRRSLLSLSALAGDREEFRAAWEWLAANDPEFLHPVRRRVLLGLVRLPLACALLALVEDARVALRRMRRYRHVDRAGPREA